MNTLDIAVKSDNIFIGLGGNLGNIEDTFSRMKEILSSKINILEESSLYRTKPVGPIQPDYLNQVLKCSTALSPMELIDFILESEKKCGRIRTSIKDGPRVIDCDLLIYDKQIIHNSKLTLPHPRIAERAFVIVPLLEVTSINNEAVAWALGVEKEKK